MPANTEWISQPAISSASSTARWMDCTVDSMLTTTPFLRPREGCEPRPNTSMAPSPPTLAYQGHHLGSADVETYDEVSFRALKHCDHRFRSSRHAARCCCYATLL